MSRHGALAAHPDQGGSHAAFLDWQHGQAAVDAGDHHDAGGGGNADYLPPLLTNVPHNNEASDEVDADDATAAAAPAAAPAARPAIPTLQRLTGAALAHALTAQNVASVLALATNVHDAALVDACTRFACAHLADVVQTEYFDDLPSNVRRRLLLCAAQAANPVGAATPGARGAFFEPREFLGIVREHVIELRERLADAELAQAEAVARAEADARTRRSAMPQNRSSWARLFSFGGGGDDAGGGAGAPRSGVEYAAEKIVQQRRRVARVEKYHAAQSKLFAALELP